MNITNPMKGVYNLGSFPFPINPFPIYEWRRLFLTDPWIRDPVENTRQGFIAMNWHRDCHDDGDRMPTVIVWSNTKPTQFKRGKRPMGDIYTPLPLELVLFDSMDADLVHRRDPSVIEKDCRITVLSRCSEHIEVMLKRLEFMTSSYQRIAPR